MDDHKKNYQDAIPKYHRRPPGKYVLGELNHYCESDVPFIMLLRSETFRKESLSEESWQRRPKDDVGTRVLRS